MSDFEPDGRWTHFMGGFDADGGLLPVTACSLRRVADSWPVSDAAPEGVNSLLKTSRTMWCLSWYEYDLLAVSASWSLLAVEAVLAERLGLGPDGEFKKMIRKAHAQGLLNDEWSERLEAGRNLRNSLLHARNQAVWTAGMAAPILRASHRVVSLLYPTTD